MLLPIRCNKEALAEEGREPEDDGLALLPADIGRLADEGLTLVSDTARVRADDTVAPPLPKALGISGGKFTLFSMCGAHPHTTL